MIKLHDLEFEPYISEEEITQVIDRISDEVNRDFGDKTPVFIGVLNGSFMFASEVVKRFQGDCEISFVKLGSYKGTESTGEVKTLLGLNQDLKDRTVVLLEDIVDTGNTLVELDQILKQSGVKEYKVVSLFFKPEAYKKSVPVDYIGMEIPNKFIVGYGLDYDGLGRNLTQVYKRKE
ncbi:hypoxanthine phosphoribosyltransferase [Gramella sp. GC03-9]|uniref:Hypoxanthine phosphoribosyltransferase n=1 Tax=Christiangramia oceanisediminis TaxID=2920386 RepID=A0A9X2L0A3_9FLAO|nr:hypoxanthine phosphoribosyltransferase [Gramella oceanisediminis]MCP9201570.1 hypoxanthine phosphoribosyltransferase [Gramella oceanisediminis]